MMPWLSPLPCSPWLQMQFRCGAHFGRRVTARLSIKAAL